MMRSEDFHRSWNNDWQQTFGWRAIRSEFPTPIVQFHASDAGCEGYDGVFRSRENPYRIDVCTPDRYIILHELAHAWEHYTLIDDVRQQFMDLRGLEVWNGNAPWQDRGVEDLAEVITAVLVNCSAGPTVSPRMLHSK